MAGRGLPRRASTRSSPRSRKRLPRAGWRAFVDHLLGLDGEMLPHAARGMWRTLISDYLELEPAFDMATAHSVELMGEWPRKRLDGFLEELHAIRHVVDHAVRRAPDASADRNNR